MATHVFETTAAQEEAITLFGQQEGALGGSPLTAAQYFQRIVGHILNARVTELNDRRRIGRSDRYERATAEDKARIDAILELYRESGEPIVEEGGSRE